MNQTQTFITSAGDEWFERNRSKIGERDPVTELIEANKIVPNSVLEIGCANGWRLAKLHEMYGADVYGIDPSKLAVWDAENIAPGARIVRGWADRVPFIGNTFEMVIYGFCLYVTDPADWFTIAAEGDRLLLDGGHIVVHDFDDTEPPYARAYEHADGVLAYHVRFVDFWLAHPWYRIAAWEHYPNNEQVVVLRKDTGAISVWR